MSSTASSCPSDEHRAYFVPFQMLGARWTHWFLATQSRQKAATSVRVTFIVPSFEPPTSVVCQPYWGAGHWNDPDMFEVGTLFREAMIREQMRRPFLPELGGLTSGGFILGGVAYEIWWSPRPPKMVEETQ